MKGVWRPQGCPGSSCKQWRGCRVLYQKEAGCMLVDAGVHNHTLLFNSSSQGIYASRQTNMISGCCLSRASTLLPTSYSKAHSHTPCSPFCNPQPACELARACFERSLCISERSVVGIQGLKAHGQALHRLCVPLLCHLPLPVNGSHACLVNKALIEPADSAEPNRCASTATELPHGEALHPSWMHMPPEHPSFFNLVKSY